MCSIALDIATISGTTHIKTFSFWPGAGKHFSGNALCNPDKSCHATRSYFALLTIKNVLYKPPRRKKSRGVKPGEQGGHAMCLPLPIKRSGNSLSRKTRTRLEKWSGVPSDWKTFPTWTCRKAVFCMIPKRVSPVTSCSSKKEMTYDSVFHQSTPHTDLQRITLMSSNITRIFSSLIHDNRDVNCSAHTKWNVWCFIRRTNYQVGLEDDLDQAKKLAELPH